MDFLILGEASLSHATYFTSYCINIWRQLSHSAVLVNSGEINYKNGFISNFVEYKDNSPNQQQPLCQSVMWPGGPPDTGH